MLPVKTLVPPNKQTPKHGGSEEAERSRRVAYEFTRFVSTVVRVVAIQSALATLTYARLAIEPAALWDGNA